jgi:hypothetical protein
MRIDEGEILQKTVEVGPVAIGASAMSAWRRPSRRPTGAPRRAVPPSQPTRRIFDATLVARAIDRPPDPRWHKKCCEPAAVGDNRQSWKTRIQIEKNRERSQ